MLNIRLGLDTGLFDSQILVCLMQAVWESGDMVVHDPLWILGFKQERIQIQASREFKVEVSLLVNQQDRD